MTVDEICKHYDLVTKSAFDNKDMPLYYSWNPILENQIRARLLDDGWEVNYASKFVNIRKDRIIFTGTTFKDALSSKITYDNGRRI